MRCLYEEKDIPYCPKPINTFERDLFKYFEDKRKSSPDSCVKCYTMFLPFLLIKIDVFS